MAVVTLAAIGSACGSPATSTASPSPSAAVATPNPAPSPLSFKLNGIKTTPYLVFDGEPEIILETRACSQPGDNAVCGPEFVAAWRHLHDLAQRHGLTRLQWVWNLTGKIYLTQASDVADYFPGTAVVDKFKESPLWNTVNAVKNHQVFFVNPFLWSKARGLLAGELIAQQAVHLLAHKFVSVALPKVSGV